MLRGRHEIEAVLAAAKTICGYARELPLCGSDGAMTVLEEKLVHAGLTEYVDLMRGRAVSAERHLIELAHRSPDEIDAVVAQLIGVVAGECDEARLEASRMGEPYGPEMLADVHRRLRIVANGRADMIHRQPYEVLAGVAGLLTEECRVWWSSRFDLRNGR